MELGRDGATRITRKNPEQRGAVNRSIGEEVGHQGN